MGDSDQGRPHLHHRMDCRLEVVEEVAHARMDPKLVRRLAVVARRGHHGAAILYSTHLQLEVARPCDHHHGCPGSSRCLLVVHCRMRRLGARHLKVWHTDLEKDGRRDRCQGQHNVPGALHLGEDAGLVEGSGLAAHHEVVLHLVDRHIGSVLEDSLAVLRLLVVDNFVAGSQAVEHPEEDSLMAGIQVEEHHSGLEVEHHVVVGSPVVADHNGQAVDRLLVVGNLQEAAHAEAAEPRSSCGSGAQLHVCTARGALPHPFVFVSLMA